MTRLVWLSFMLACVACVCFSADALAQSSLGIGRSEQTVPTGGLFGEFFNWVRQNQAEFNQAIRMTLVDMRQGGAGIWPLITISFLYGVFHAIGPGHGKVVVTSYMLANEVALKRGVIVSMAAALMQGVTAIAAISFFLVALRGSGIKTGDLAYTLEIASYVGVMGVGLWLLWRKLYRKPSHQHHDHSHDHEHVGDGVHCDHCGHSHAPDPGALQGSFGLREAWGAILVVGLRPCTGALIVLVFCFANGLYFAGVASTLAMAVGTGMAVSTLAILAVTAKNTALRIADAQEKAAGVQRSIEIIGAILIFLIGLTLFIAAVS